MKYIIYIFLLFFSLSPYAQITRKKSTKPERIIYRGIVVDENQEPLPFVNVYMRKGKFGTTTDDNGEFELKTRRKRGKITFSLMGYETKIIKPKPKNPYLRIVLKEEKNVLDEVVIVQRPKKRLKKKENPAYKILKGIWQHKKRNGLQLLNRYEYKKYDATEIGLNRVDSLFLKKLFKKDYRQVLDELPFDSEGFNKYIPIFIKELVYRVYGDNKLGKQRIDIEAEKNKGFVQNGFVFDRMANKFDAVDIYQNSFDLFNKSFVSPISSTGFDTYDYLLYDSIQQNHHKLYNIYFWPRRAVDLAFVGNFLVDKRTFAVTKIKMKLNRDVNINFVRGLSIEKEYKMLNDTIFLPKSDVFEGDFTLIDKNDQHNGINIKKTYLYTDYNFKSRHSSEFYDKNIIKYKPKQFVKDSAFWQSYTDLSQSGKTYSLIDKIKGKKRIQNMTKWINILTTGYFNLAKNVQFGPLFQAVGRNGVEGWRLMAGFRTFKSPDDRFRLSGHLAYGTRDKKMKYGVQAEYLLSYKPRIALSATWSDDYVQQARQLLNVSNIMFVENLGANFVLSRGKNVFLSRIQEKSLKFDFRLAKNFHLGFIPSHKTIQPADRHLFNMDYMYKNFEVRHKVIDAGADFFLTYTPGRDVYGLGVAQRYGKNAFPSFILNYHKSFSFLNSDFSYSRLQFRYDQYILWGKFGKTDAMVELGKTFGTVPLALLNPIPANQVLIQKPYTFSLLNYYDFVTDTYATAYFTHHFNGLILNRLPLIKKLKLRTVVAFRLAYGQISNANKSINFSNIHYAAPDQNMYYEYSVGLENIGYGNLRFIRVDAIWRSPHHSINGLHSPRFAVRMAIKPDF